MSNHVLTTSHQPATNAVNDTRPRRHRDGDAGDNRSFPPSAFRFPPSVRLYVEFARRSFQRHLAYRQAALAGIFTNSVFGVLIASVFSGLYRSREQSGAVAGFELAEMMTFVWVGQSLLAPVAIFGTWEIAAAIRSGDVVVDLMKPFNFYAYWLSRDLGRAACQVCLRSIPTFLIGLALYDVAAPPSLAYWALFTVSVVLATIVSFAFRFILNVAGFWLTDITGIRSISYVASTFLSGLLVPLTFFPGWLRVIADALPFRAFVMTPIEVFLGHGSPLIALAIQAFWAVAMSGLALLTLDRAFRKVVIQGG